MGESATKGHEKTFRDDECVHCLQCGDGFMGICVSQILSNYTWNMCNLQQLYFNKAALLKILSKRSWHCQILEPLD